MLDAFGENFVTVGHVLVLVGVARAMLLDDPPDLGHVSRGDCIGASFEKCDFFLQTNMVARDGMRLRPGDAVLFAWSGNQILLVRIGGPSRGASGAVRCEGGAIVTATSL